MAASVTIKTLNAQANTYTTIGGDDQSTLSLSQILMEPSEIAFYEKPVKLEETDMKNLAVLAAYAAALLFPDQVETATPPKLNPEGLHKVTIAVERELRGLDVSTMTPTNYLHRINIHSRFTTAQDKGATTSKILHKDTSGSKILVKGPYALTFGEAVEAAKTDLEKKLGIVAGGSGAGSDAGWMLAPITEAVGGADGSEPHMPCSVWAAVNLTVAAVEDA